MNKRVVWTLCVLTMLLLNIGVASGHRWENYRWFGDNLLRINTVNFETSSSRAVEEWDYKTKLTLKIDSQDADIKSYGRDFGNTGWWGLAVPKHVDFHCSCGYCAFQYAHALYNTYYEMDRSTYAEVLRWYPDSYDAKTYKEKIMADRQEVFCHEYGHLFGLHHHPSSFNNCLGSGSGVDQHLANDINSIY